MNRAVYIARHGQTDWNLEKRFQGRNDIPLNSTGKEQAKRLGVRLQNCGIDIIFSSPKKRATETAEIVADVIGLNREIQIIPELREISHGIFDGLTMDEVYSRHGEAIEKWRNDRINIAPPEGESISDCYDRVIPVYDEIVSNTKDETILIVTHLIVAKSILIHCLNAPLETFWHFDQGSTALNKIHYTQKGAVVELLNDIMHTVEK